MPLVHPHDYLEAYAAGHTSEAVSLIIATHLAMCPECRAEITRLEAIGGAVMEAAPEAKVDGDSMARVMATISAQSQEQPVIEDTSHLEEAIEAGDIILPSPLREYLPVVSLEELERLNWSRLPGFAELNVEVGAGGVKTRLMRIAAGNKMPRHTHDGAELTLVLRGGYTDVHGHYGVGDLAVADAGVDHAPEADDGEDCICLAVTDAPLKLTGPVGRLLNPFVKL